MRRRRCPRGDGGGDSRQGGGDVGGSGGFGSGGSVSIGDDFRCSDCMAPPELLCHDRSTRYASLRTTPWRHGGTRPCVRIHGGTAALVPAYEYTEALRHASLLTNTSWHGGTRPCVRIHGGTEVPAFWPEQCRICNHSIPQIHLPLESPVRLCGDTAALLRAVPHAQKKLLVF